MRPLLGSWTGRSDGNLNCHCFRGFYGARAVGGSASHDISYMRRRYSALSIARRRTELKNDCACH